VQKYAAHMLGLPFPFPTCSGSGEGIYCVEVKSNTQEVRAADDSVVVPSDLHLPKDAEVQKYAAHMLGLPFPFPTCSGDCSLSHRCFATPWKKMKSKAFFFLVLRCFGSTGKLTCQ